MRKGTLEFCVMALLRVRPRYGYELVQELAKGAGMIASEGTIYPLLSRLRKDRMVETEWRESSGGPPRKYYRLTPAGSRALESFQLEWTSFSAAVDRILKARGVS